MRGNFPSPVAPARPGRTHCEGGQRHHQLPDEALVHRAGRRTARAPAASGSGRSGRARAGRPRPHPDDPGAAASTAGSRPVVPGWPPRASANGASTRTRRSARASGSALTTRSTRWSSLSTGSAVSGTAATRATVRTARSYEARTSSQARGGPTTACRRSSTRSRCRRPAPATSGTSSSAYGCSTTQLSEPGRSSVTSSVSAPTRAEHPVHLGGGQQHRGQRRRWLPLRPFGGRRQHVRGGAGEQALARRSR